jgi:8-oxo-dGTP pyrophosphatase MutT (NUDIX family)
LLVFRHDDPVAGLQTPGGSLDPGETSIDGARREAFEEAGLADFADVHAIAVDHVDHPRDPVERYIVHLKVDGAVADSWTHRVTAGAADAGLLFHCFWLTLRAAKFQVVPNMVSHLDAVADRLTGDSDVQIIS